MRAFIAAALAMTLTASAAVADTGALSAGKPAGVQKAQLETGGVLLVLGILAAAGAIAAIAANTQGSTTTGTSA